MKECPSCGVEISKSENVCPICQYEFPGSSKPYVKPVVILLVLLMLYPMIKFIINLIF